METFALSHALLDRGLVQGSHSNAAAFFVSSKLI